MPKVSSKLMMRARELRAFSTAAERALWRCLRNHQLNGWHFRRQHPIPPYVVDFACVEARLIIEADGGQHGEIQFDRRRTKTLEKQRCRILRFWNQEKLQSMDQIREIIAGALGPHPNALPLRGRGSKAHDVTRTPEEGEPL